MVEGEERIGVCARAALTEKTAYDADNDVTLYEEPALPGRLTLRAGDFVVLAPEDAHKPRCAAGAPQAVKKIVIKVPVNAVI